MLFKILRRVLTYNKCLLFIGLGIVVPVRIFLFKSTFIRLFFSRDIGRHRFDEWVPQG